MLSLLISAFGVCLGTWNREDETFTTYLPKLVVLINGSFFRKIKFKNFGYLPLETYLPYLPILSIPVRQAPLAALLTLVRPYVDRLASLCFAFPPMRIMF